MSKPKRRVILKRGQTSNERRAPTRTERHAPTLTQVRKMILEGGVTDVQEIVDTLNGVFPDGQLGPAYAHASGKVGDWKPKDVWSMMDRKDMAEAKVVLERAHAQNGITDEGLVPVIRAAISDEMREVRESLGRVKQQPALNTDTISRKVGDQVTEELGDLKKQLTSIDETLQLMEQPTLDDETKKEFSALKERVSYSIRMIEKAAENTARASVEVHNFMDSVHSDLQDSVTTATALLDEKLTAQLTTVNKTLEERLQAVESKVSLESNEIVSQVVATAFGQFQNGIAAMVQGWEKKIVDRLDECASTLNSLDQRMSALHEKVGAIDDRVTNLEQKTENCADVVSKLQTEWSS